MRSLKSFLTGAVFAALFTAGAASKAHASDDTASLNAKQQSIVPIAAFTASGDLEKLKPALVDGLEAGLTISEINEILVQMYAYAGFPRSLNGIFALMAIVDERQAKGIQDPIGRNASPVPSNIDKGDYGAKVRASLTGVKDIPPPAKWQQFSPIVDTFLKEHLFADIFARDVLNHQERELATIAALANMTGTAGQLRFHLGAAMNTGLTEPQMHAFVAVLKAKVGSDVAETASKLLAEVIKTRSN